MEFWFIESCGLESGKALVRRGGVGYCLFARRWLEGYDREVERADKEDLLGSLKTENLSIIN